MTNLVHQRLLSTVSHSHVRARCVAKFLVVFFFAVVSAFFGGLDGLQEAFPATQHPHPPCTVPMFDIMMTQENEGGVDARDRDTASGKDSRSGGPRYTA